MLVCFSIYACMFNSQFYIVISSGTEGELMELLDDISAYVHDGFELKTNGKGGKKKKLNDKKKADEMMKATMKRMASKFTVHVGYNSNCYLR